MGHPKKVDGIGPIKSIDARDSGGAIDFVAESLRNEHAINGYSKNGGH